MERTREVRVAVGTPNGRRSTVWKFSVHKSDIYIFSRMFGSDAKVSLHASGECQWSGTGVWVKKAATRRNADRHFMKWVAPRPTGSAAMHVFQVRIPETELRVSELPEDLNEVEWLPVPPVGSTVSLECYITPPSQSNPALYRNLPFPHLFSLPLADGRWLTVLHHIPPLDGKDFEHLRSQMNAQAHAAGIEPNPKHRGSAFTVGEGATRGLIELCTVGSNPSIEGMPKRLPLLGIPHVKRYACSMNNIALKTLGVVATLILLIISILLAVTLSGIVNPRNIIIFSFVTVLFDYPFVIPACLIFLPSLLWKQSMFLAYSLIFGLLLIAPLVQVIYQIYSGFHRGGFGEALGLFIFSILAFCYILGLIMRMSVQSTIKSKKLVHNEKTT